LTARIDYKGKRKSFKIGDKINILAQADAHSGTCVELESCLRLSVSTLNTTMKVMKSKKSSVDLPPSSRYHCNVHHWRN
jgi:hypothetical protein